MVESDKQEIAEDVAPTVGPMRPPKRCARGASTQNKIEPPKKGISPAATGKGGLT
jgi:hypothetical protein